MIENNSDYPFFSVSSRIFKDRERDGERGFVRERGLRLVMVTSLRSAVGASRTGLPFGEEWDVAKGSPSPLFVWRREILSISVDISVAKYREETRAV